MRPRVSPALVVLALLAASLGGAYALSFAGGRAVPADPLARAPAGTTGLVHVDMPGLLESRLWAALVAGDDEGDLARLTERCGFDPLRQLATVDVYVVGTERHPFEQAAFFARGGVPRATLTRCVERTLADEGDADSIRTVEIEGEPALASTRGPSRAAFVGRDGIVGGEEPLVRELVRVAHGAASPGADPELARVLRTVEGRGELSIALRLPEPWQRALAALAGDVEGAEALASARALALGARLRRGLGLTIVASLASEEDARALAAGLSARRDALLADPLVRLSALGGAVRGAAFDTRGGDTIATVDLDDAALDALVALVRQALDARRAPAVASPVDAPPALPPADLVIRSPGAAPAAE